jgi:hypothetical protein
MGLIGFKQWEAGSQIAQAIINLTLWHESNTFPWY